MNTDPNVTTLMLALSATSDPLRQLAAADDFRASLFHGFIGSETTPVRAAALVALVERGHRITGHGQVLAAHAAQRTLVHELDDARLTSIDAALEPSGAFASGATDLPSEDYSPRAGKPLFRDATEFLHRRLCITRTEAGNRIASAALLLPGTDDYGLPRPARFPLLGGLLGTAEADPGNLTSAARKLAELRLSSDRLPDGPVIATDLERAVAESVRTQDSRGTRAVLQQLEAGLEAAALDPSPEELHARQGMFFVSSRRGLDEWKVLCTADQSEVLLTCFDTINNPRLKTNRVPATWSGGASASVVGSRSDAAAPAPPSWFGIEATDPRAATGPGGIGDGSQTTGGWDSTTAQRRLELLITACRGELSGTGASGPKRPRTQLVVSIDYRSLLGQLEAAGSTAHGAQLAPATIRRLACDAEVIPLLLDTNGRVLDLGRSTRKFPTHQRVAIAHRDRGCVFPGCTEPPEHCEIHHVEFWRDGGVTSVDNGAMLCVSHHHVAHLGAFGIKVVNGVPYVLPPTSLDPLRRPIRNTYWHPELIGNPQPPGSIPGVA
ncbi:HNH endonuclease signature motif containing protein [Paeniglutamicibacter cryotolerans]|uniref:HNH nuclease domain-containing protein n=1 Tax=Paeniglutamicibacter cryotolerans TaxID=670079 RepID=A0A839QQ54_9MICC|nr:HNH endonuclease signature motif containing protein [Paeniglutamicibacter cryotolerans]MBB2996884.1 hypothetical protein [Paeniglutamicibacter cryotolerans]